MGSVFGIVYGGSNLFGPTLGGWLAEYGPLLSSLVTTSSRWRWVFYINLPVGLSLWPHSSSFCRAISRYTPMKGQVGLRCVVLMPLVLSSPRRDHLPDVGVDLGSSQMFGWNSPQVIASLAVGVALFVLFVLIERNAAEPILPLDLFRNQVWSSACAPLHAPDDGADGPFSSTCRSSYRECLPSRPRLLVW